ncbi:MAG: hypothetical protein JNN01_19810 [Opitutaceae bacterium]|nr:hypothetical protein [Opitutaceae bacterium]
MPSLKQQVADKKQKSALKRTPENDAKLDQFIAQNPKLHEYYGGFTKEELIRKLMMKKMRGSEYRAGDNAELRTWVEEQPGLKAKIEERIRNVPATNREQAFINVARREAQQLGMRSNGVRP